MPLDQEAPTRQSRWRQIAASLQGEIEAGDHAPGAKLPGEHALAARFSVNRHTVRQAMGYLADHGLVQVEQGRGMFVRRPPVDYPVGPRTRFTEMLRGEHHRPTRSLIDSATLPAPADLAGLLEIMPGVSLIKLEVLNQLDGEPLGFSEHFFVTDRVPGLPDHFRRLGSLTSALKELDIEYRRRSTAVRAVSADARAERLIGLKRGRPMLVTESVNVDSSGRPLEVARSWMDAARMTLSIEHPD